MRLINTQSLELKDFIGNHPPYAILSHMWEDEEISLQELQHGDHDAVSRKSGYKKVLRCCEVARKAGYAWAWVDTCCIDKGSSADLSECINSMYEFYAKSDECFVYMGDVKSGHDEWETGFRASRWFKRGWTVGLVQLLLSIYAYG
jgi:hypothetical protein